MNHNSSAVCSRRDSGVTVGHSYRSQSEIDSAVGPRKSSDRGVGWGFIAFLGLLGGLIGCKSVDPPVSETHQAVYYESSENKFGQAKASTHVSIESTLLPAAGTVGGRQLLGLLSPRAAAIVGGTAAVVGSSGGKSKKKPLFNFSITKTKVRPSTNVVWVDKKVVDAFERGLVELEIGRNSHTIFPNYQRIKEIRVRNFGAADEIETQVFDDGTSLSFDASYHLVGNEELLIRQSLGDSYRFLTFPGAELVMTMEDPTLVPPYWTLKISESYLPPEVVASLSDSDRRLIPQGS